MENSIYLFSAFSFAWVIIFIYILSMLKRQKLIEIQIGKLREILENEQTGSS